jgi:hypothetical protein
MKRSNFGRMLPLDEVDFTVGLHEMGRGAYSRRPGPVPSLRKSG